MKKLLISAICLLVPILTFSQKSTTLPIDSSTKKVTFEKIILSKDSLSKDLLYNLTKEWIAINYRSAKDVIQMQDNISGIIVCKGILVIPIGKGVLRTNENCRHIITCKFKDGRIKVVITDLVMEWKGSPESTLEEIMKGGLLMKRDVPILEKDLIERMEKIIQSLEIHINQQRKDDW